MANLPEKKSVCFQKRKQADSYADRLRRKGFAPVIKEREQGDYIVLWSNAPQNRI